jgi:hypothetical protein
MKSSLHNRAALIAAIGIFFFLVPVAHAQDAGNVRVVRLSRVEGQVLVSHSGSNVWEDASINLPLQEGDTLATQAGLAGIEFDNGATAYLAENSVLQFTQLGFVGGGRATDLTLAQGTGNFYASLTGQDTFRVETLTFNVTIPQHGEFRVDGFKDGAAVEVFLGDVSVSTTRGSTNLEKGESVAVHQNDLKDFSIGSLPTAEDAFDQWLNEQGEMIRSGNKNTLSYINSPNIYGLSDLDRYGTWVNIAGFGNTWRPFGVGFTWTPYFNGKFILDPNLGWIWVSSEPWGWMPYHFGSWLLSPNLGWVWVPGGPGGLNQWEPSRVNWVSAGNQVGWVAKSPNDREGAPANAARGIVIMSAKAPGKGSESNQIVSGKDLRNIAPLRQPPPEFAARIAPGLNQPGIKSTTRVAPRTPDNNQSIAYESATHTNNNRGGNNETASGNLPTARNNAPVSPATLMPESKEQNEVPRLAQSPSGPLKSQLQGIYFPPPNPASPAQRGNFPVSGIVPARPQGNAPFNAGPRPISPTPLARPPVIPSQGTPGVFRSPSPLPVPPRPAAPPAAAPHPAPAGTGSSPRPATQTARPASPQNPADKR